MGLATARHPAGPWTKQTGNFFYVEGVKFPSDDNYIWFEDGRYYAIVKDQGGHFQTVDRQALVLFASRDALNWELTSPDPVITTFRLVIDNRPKGPFERLDQPQLIFDPAGNARALCLSVKEKRDEENNDLAYTVNIPLRRLEDRRTK
jgi:hypothetical protein